MTHSFTFGWSDDLTQPLHADVFNPAFDPIWSDADLYPATPIAGVSPRLIRKPDRRLCDARRSPFFNRSKDHDQR